MNVHDNANYICWYCKEVTEHEFYSEGKEHIYYACLKCKSDSPYQRNFHVEFKKKTRGNTMFSALMRTLC